MITMVRCTGSRTRIRQPRLVDIAGKSSGGFYRSRKLPALMRVPRRLIGRLVAAGLLLPLCIAFLGAQPLEDRLPACFACHGENGQSQLPDVPSLGAQPRLYALIQLVLFRDKLRVLVPMNEMLSGLKDDELR